MVTERRRVSSNKSLDPRTKREISDALADDVSKWLDNGNVIESVDTGVTSYVLGQKGGGKALTPGQQKRHGYGKPKV